VSMLGKSGKTQMRTFRLAIGLLFWLNLFGFATWRIEQLGDNQRAGRGQWAGQLWQYFTGTSRRIHAAAGEPVELAVGDPVFVRSGQRELKQVGQVRRLKYGGAWLARTRAWADEAELMLMPSAPACGPDATVIYYSREASLAWAVRTLLTEERQAAIAAELQQVFDQHGEELLNSIRPLVVQTLIEASAVLEQDLPAAIARRRARWDALGQRYQDEIVERELVPLVRTVIWPIVVQRATPLTDRIGQELWERVSLWRFAWRMAYDRAPLLPELELTRQEWQRFVQEEAIPVIESHVDEIIVVVQQILADVSRNEVVREAVRRNLHRIATDPEFQLLVQETLNDVLVRNRRMHEAISRVWTSPQAMAAMRLATSRFEPAVRRIAVILLGSLEEGVTPEFARVLRVQVLGKDRRWLLLQPGTKRPGPSTTQRVKLVAASAADSLTEPQVPALPNDKTD